MKPITSWWTDIGLAQLRRAELQERRNAARLPGWRTAPRRRALTVLAVLSAVALAAGAVVNPGAAPWVYLGLNVAGLVLGGTSWYLLRVLTGTMSSAFSELLDEREREWRHRVTFFGYQVFATLMILGLAYFAFVAKQPDAGDRVVRTMPVLVLTGLAAPALALGWTLPDDYFEEGDLDVGH